MTFPKFRKNEDLINKSNFGFFSEFIALGKNACFQKLHFRPRVEVHFVRLIFRSRGKFTLLILSSFRFFFIFFFCARDRLKKKSAAPWAKGPSH